MGARAEGAPGLDHDCGPVRRRLGPRRADPERPDAHRTVERFPPVAPVRRDVLRARAAERVPQPFLSAGVRVCDQLDAVVRVDFFEALGEELQHARSCLFDAYGGDRHRDAPQLAQRNALLSLSKNPSPGSYVSWPASRSNSSSSCRCSSVRRRGTVTLTSTRWLPRPNPCRTGRPRPRSTTTSPGCVPGSKVISVSPESVWTVTVAPSAACVIVRSTVVYTSFPSRTKRSSGRTCTSTYTSPARPPAAPTCPSPLSRMRWPSWMPAGISTSSVRSSNTRPAPSHFSHGCSISLPAPLHVGQVPARTNSPKTLRDTCRTRPLPPQVGQVVTGVSGSAPLPPQRSHGTATPNGTSRFVPVATSARSISTRAAMSAPRARPMRPPIPNRSSPKKAEKRSERLPRSNVLGSKPPLRRPAWPKRSYSSRRSEFESTS